MLEGGRQRDGQWIRQLPHCLLLLGQLTQHGSATRIGQRLEGAVEDICSWGHITIFQPVRPYSQADA